VKNATRLITGLGAIAVVAVVALGWFLGVSPLLAQAAQSDSDRADVVTQNDALRAELVILKAQFDNIAEYEERLALLNVLIPDEDPLEEFYVAVDRCGIKAGATGLDSITTMDAIPYQVAAVADGVIITPGATLAPRLFTVPVTIKLVADPAISAKFLSCMQKDWPRSLAITNFALSAGKGGGLELNGYLFRVTDPASIPGRLAEPFDDGEGEGEESAETAGDESEEAEETPEASETAEPETPDPSATATPAP
jgi:hypothetical protein